MQRIQSNKLIEGTLFVAFAFAVWFAMRVAKTNVSRQINIELVAQGRGVGDQRWLTDTTAEVAITIEARGLDALFMKKFDRRKVSFKSVDFINTSPKHAYVIRADIKAILRETFGSEYSYILTKDTVVFPSEPMVYAKKHVNVMGLEEIVLPLDSRWVVRPKLLQDSIMIYGPSELVAACNPYVQIPKSDWKGAKTYELALLGINKAIRTDKHWLPLSGEIAQWTEEKFDKTIKIKDREISVELWISGPMNVLANESFLNSVEVSWSLEEERYRIHPQIENYNVDLLNYSPKYVAI